MICLDLIYVLCLEQSILPLSSWSTAPRTTRALPQSELIFSPTWLAEADNIQKVWVGLIKATLFRDYSSFSSSLSTAVSYLLWPRGEHGAHHFLASLIVWSVTHGIWWWGLALYLVRWGIISSTPSTRVRTGDGEIRSLRIWYLLSSLYIRWCLLLGLILGGLAGARAWYSTRSDERRCAHYMHFSWVICNLFLCLRLKICG